MEDGWHDYMNNAPPKGILVLFWREGWDKPLVGYSDRLHPESNVCGLYWKLTGIAKEW